MYFSKYHKNVLKAISEKKDFYDLDDYIQNMSNYQKHKKFMSFLRKKEENEVLYTRDDKNITKAPLFFSGFEVPRGTKMYLVKEGARDIFYIRVKELVLLLDFLQENNMITCIRNFNKGCLPVFIEKDKLFDDVLNLIKKYLNMKIYKMEGFKKFEELKYRTPKEAHEKKLRFILSFLIPLTFLIIKVIIDLIFKYILPQ
jgi:hypothetical protein